MPKISNLQDHIGFWMRTVSNYTTYHFAKKLEHCEVTVAEWVILREMYGSDEIIPPSKVAELTGLTRGAISKLIERLLNKDLVTREEAFGDRRFQELRLTKKASKLIPELAKIADENDEFIFSALNKSEQKDLKNLLMKIVIAHEIKSMPLE